MRPFTFRLATVLRLRQRAEEAARTELLRQQAATTAAKAHADGLQQRLDDARREVTHGATSDPDPAWHRNWIVSLTAQVDTARQRVAQCLDAEQAARLAWQGTRRDQRVIERLRERAVVRHRHEMDRMARTQMDELAGRQVGTGRT